MSEESLRAGFPRLAYTHFRVGPHLEKIAIYADAFLRPRHAARQLPSGRWTSKLGTLEDVEHDLEGLEGRAYGSVVLFLARSLGNPAAR